MSPNGPDRREKSRFRVLSCGRSGQPMRKRADKHGKGMGKSRAGIKLFQCVSPETLKKKIEPPEVGSIFDWQTLPLPKGVGTHGHLASRAACRRTLSSSSSFGRPTSEKPDDTVQLRKTQAIVTR